MVHSFTGKLNTGLGNGYKSILDELDDFTFLDLFLQN